MRTRDQRYAEDAYKRVMAIEKQEFAARYGAMAHTLPVLILTSGLVQALTFADTRKETGPARLLEDLSKTVFDDSAGKEQLLAEARGNKDDRASSLHSYIYLTRQVLDALLWYKRYAQSILHVEQGEDEESIHEGAGNNG